MSQHYLVKLRVHVLQVNGNWNCEPKNTNIFVTLLQLQKRVFSVKILYILS